MNIYVMIGKGAPIAAFWSRERAESLQNYPGAYEIFEIPLEPLCQVIARYYGYRNMQAPDEMQSLAFLTSELGEFADAMVSNVGNWTRNNPDRERDEHAEAGDVLMMLHVTGKERRIDPIAAMLDKFHRKGFRDG